jgi:glyoxylase-like metal-dependent hydrolase (beta-lactamase superfamily II)
MERRTFLGGLVAAAGIPLVAGIPGLSLEAPDTPRQLKKLASFGDANSDLYVWTDTANCYVLRDGDRALLFDLGDGSVLDALAGIGVSRVEWVLFTNHHREHVQGTPLLAKWHPQIAVSKSERAFFETPSAFRKMKPSLADPFTVHGSSYLRTPVHPIPVDLTFERLDDFTWAGHTIRCVETRGNSPGGMTYFLQHANGFIAISGDVMLDDARMHNWFDTEWDYGFGAGLYALVDSAAFIERYNPFMMLPAHGPAIGNPKQQLAEFQLKLRRLEPLYLRGYSEGRFAGADQDRVSTPTAIPHVWQLSPHLYKFKGPRFAPNFNLILADDGHGLLVDCGLLDHKFLDTAIERIQQHLGLKQIDACVITHMHGDHMLEADHLRNTWGAQVWVLDNMVDKCEHPEWFDYVASIESYPTGVAHLRVDRSFTPGEAFDWRGYHFTIDWMPGQTEFALAMRGMIDGRSVVFTGDNIFGDPADPKQNGHEAVVARNSSILEEGYIYGAEYLKRINPDIIVGGHSYVMDRPAQMIERYRQNAYELRTVFQTLSNDKDYQYWYDPYWVRAQPYRVELQQDLPREVVVHVRNFRSHAQSHHIEIHTPPGVVAEPAVLDGSVPPSARTTSRIQLRRTAEAVAGVHIIAFDITLDGHRYGELFDAIVEIT